MTEDDVSVMSSRIIFESETTELVSVITDKQIREVSVQLFSVSVPELTVISVQFSRISTSLLEVIAQVFISRAPSANTPMNEGIVDENDSLKEIYRRESTALPSTSTSCCAPETIVPSMCNTASVVPEEATSVCESEITEDRVPSPTTFTTNLYDNGALESASSSVEQGNSASPQDSVDSPLGCASELVYMFAISSAKRNPIRSTDSVELDDSQPQRPFFCDDQLFIESNTNIDEDSCLRRFVQ